jgi:hypothetical protein
MWKTMLLGLAMVGCASTGFHEGRTSLGKNEQALLRSPQGTSKNFGRFWQAPNPGPWGLVQWDPDRSWAVPEAPRTLLRDIRDQLGRLNQRAGTAENLSLAITVYRWEPAGTWHKPTAFYEMVGRDPRGKIAWAVDDTVRVTEDLAQTLADTPSDIIAREVLRKVREQFGI